MPQPKPNPLTPVAELGEFGLIGRLQQLLPPPHPAVLKGIGDDAAVIKLPRTNPSEVILSSTDMLLEGIHFDLAYAPLSLLGHKAVAVAVSDIYAMNARPVAITVGLAFSSRFTVEAIEELYKGMAVACEDYNLDLVGGDTCGSKAGLVISVSVIGRACETTVVYRNTARVHDLLVVSGDLGAAFAGLKVLQREKTIYMQNPDVQPELTDYEYVVERQLKPQARLDLYDLFEQQNIRPSAMIDVSDGLASEVAHICRQSNLGAVVYQNQLPIDKRTHLVANEFGLHATHFALYGGEDYEMLFTLSPTDYARIQDYPGLTVVGHTTEPEQGIRIILADGTETKLEPLGFNHFAEPQQA